MIEWASAARRLAGETESGDTCVVATFDGGTLIGVIDGLGHGHDAAVASTKAVSVLRDRASLDVVSLMEACHAELVHTRGAAVSLVGLSEEDSKLIWIGVGDVSATLVRSGFSAQPRESLLLRPGIVGQFLPRLIAETLPLYPNDALVMCTDGIRGRHIEALDDIRAPQETADALLADYGREYDDALALVACYRVGGK